MSDQEKREQEIMNQEMSKDEMDTVAGGLWCIMGHSYAECDNRGAKAHGRPIRRPDGSIDCANTVEDGSSCETNDACYEENVKYYGLKDCAKAWM